MSNQGAPTPGFNIVRVLATVVVVAAIGGGGYALYSKLMTDPGTLYEATGEVVWNGKPVTVGAVMTLHESADPYLSTLGPLDENGHFSLMTNMKPGAAVGRHTLIVASYGEGMPPPALVPQEYTSYDDTPLDYVVTSDPQSNHYVFELQGDPPPQRGRGGPPNDGPPSSNGGPAEEASSPDATDSEASIDEASSN